MIKQDGLQLDKDGDIGGDEDGNNNDGDRNKVVGSVKNVTCPAGPN